MGPKDNDKWDSGRVIKGAAVEQIPMEETPVGSSVSRLTHKVEAAAQVQVSYDGGSGIPLGELEEMLHTARASGANDDDLVKYAAQSVARNGGHVTQHMFYVKVDAVPAYSSSKPPSRRIITPKRVVKTAGYGLGGVAAIGILGAVWQVLQVFIGWF